MTDAEKKAAEEAAKKAAEEAAKKATDISAMANNAEIKFADTQSRDLAVKHINDLETAANARIKELEKQLEEASKANNSVMFSDLPSNVVTIAQQQFTVEAQLLDQFCGKDEGKKLQLSTALNACATIGDRRKMIVGKVMEEQKVDTSKWTVDQIDASFTTLAVAFANNTQAEESRTIRTVITPTGSPIAVAENTFFRNPWAAAKDRMLGIKPEGGTTNA